MAKKRYKKYKKGKKPRRPHDPVHRRIFTHPGMIEQILRRFATGPWAAQLDFSTLELVPAHYVSRFLSQRESDIVWKVRYGPGEDEWFFVYILMELQSSVPRFMALRLWVYIALLYQHLLKHKQLTPSRLLPPVLPIVLYNGEAPWTAALSLAELIQPLLGLARPDFEYVVLDASHYPIEELRPVENVVSGVFLMEQAESLAELETIVDELRDLLIDDKELEEDIALLVGSVAGKLAKADEKVPPMRTFQEVKNMLLERAERWPKQWLAEGLEKGREEGLEKGLEKGRKEGLEKGLRKGKAELSKALASHRFGELPQWAVERFDRADVDSLDRWSRHLLDAKRLEDVFDDASK